MTSIFQLKENYWVRNSWVSNGLAEGTQIVADINAVYVGSQPEQLITIGNKIFFTADDGIHGRELWASDGSIGGSYLVKDIYTYADFASSSIGNLTNVNGTLFFNANDYIHGTELWKSDGTLEGTVMVKDISAGTTNSSRTNLTNVNGTLFFSAFTAATG